MDRRVAFFVSDGTGLTAETLGNAMLSQFQGVEFDTMTLPYILSEDATRQAIAKINEAADRYGNCPIVFSSLVDRGHRDLLGRSRAVILDVFQAFMGPLEQELGVRSSLKVGQSHAIHDPEAYRLRIEAVHFALDNDDGVGWRHHYEKADLILVGLPQAGKTPTSLYLALQYGLFVANYPLTEQDIEDASLPEVLVPFRDKLFGLSMDPYRLALARQELAGDDLQGCCTDHCTQETEAARALFEFNQLPNMDVTKMSVEEISTRILALTGLKRRLQ